VHDETKVILNIFIQLKAVDCYLVTAMQSAISHYLQLFQYSSMWYFSAEE